jgi:hypothetical protein
VTDDLFAATLDPLARQLWQAARSTLARAELEDGWLHDEAVARAESEEAPTATRLAAAEPSGPRTYGDDAVTLHASPHPDGGWLVTVVGAAQAELGGVLLTEGAWARVAVLPEPMRVWIGGVEKMLGRR